MTGISTRAIAIFTAGFGALSIDAFEPFDAEFICSVAGVSFFLVRLGSAFSAQERTACKGTDFVCGAVGVIVFSFAVIAGFCAFWIVAEELLISVAEFSFCEVGTGFAEFFGSDFFLGQFGAVSRFDDRG